MDPTLYSWGYRKELSWKIHEISFIKEENKEIGSKTYVEIKLVWLCITTVFCTQSCCYCISFTLRVKHQLVHSFRPKNMFEQIRSALGKQATLIRLLASLCFLPDLCTCTFVSNFEIYIFHYWLQALDLYASCAADYFGIITPLHYMSPRHRLCSSSSR